MKAFCDVHIHNYLSNCCSDNQATAESHIEQAAELGLRVLGFANHIWDERVPGESSWYHKQSLAFSMQIKNQIPADTKGVRVLIGAETEYCGMSNTLGMSLEGARQLDFLLIPHSHVHMHNFVMPDPPEYAAAREKLRKNLLSLPGMSEEQALTWANSLREKPLRPFLDAPYNGFPAYLADFLVKSFENLMDHPTLQAIAAEIPVSIAHPFQPVGYSEHTVEMLTLISDETFQRLFRKAAALGVGLEINPHCNYPQMLRMLKIAKDCGCKFTLGSDAHSPSSMDAIFATEATTEALGITEKHLMEFLK